MLEYILTISLILLLWLSYSCIHAPQKKIQFYKKHLQAKGYKVYVFPFKAFSVPMLDVIFKKRKNIDPLHYHQNQFTKCDVLVQNVLNNIAIEFICLQGIKQFYAKQKQFTYEKMKAFIEPITRGFGNGMIISEGEEWWKRRKILNRIFNFEFLKSMTPEIARICDQGFALVEEKYATKLQRGVYKYYLYLLTTNIFANIILKIFLGADGSKLTIDGKPAYLFIMQLVVDLNSQVLEIPGHIFGVKYFDIGITDQHRKINRKIDAYQKWGKKYVNSRIKQEKQKFQRSKVSGQKQADNIIGALIKNQENESTQGKYTEQMIFGEFGMFFVAGTDTTAHFLESMVYLIAAHPRIENKLRQLINKFMKQDDYSFQNLKNLSYIDYIQKETSRLLGPAPFMFGRKAVKDHYILGTPIRKGTIVGPLPIVNHFKNQFFPDPFQFQPQRWENQSNQIPQYAIGGFSFGARTCIGKHLAYLESKICLIKIFKRYSKIQIPYKNYKEIETELRFLYAPQKIETVFTVSNDHIQKSQ